MYCALFAILNSETFILTANQRLAEHLHRQYNIYQQRQQNVAAWPTPHILALNNWLSEQWQKHPLTSGVLLADHEETLIWQSIVAEDELAQSLLQINNTAQYAKQAWQMLRLWEVNKAEVGIDNDEIRRFLQWSEQFETLKATHEWFTPAELATQLKNLLTQHSQFLPKKILLVGFDDIAPTYAKFLTACETYCQIERFEPSSINIVKHRIVLPNRDQEILNMAHWAKTCLTEPKERELKIGCVIPNLNAIRDKVDRIFTETFANEENPELFFNISAGHAFNQIPMIQSVLQVLALRQGDLKFENVKAFLLSPYINSHPSEKCLAHHADVLLSQRQEFVLTPNLVQATLSQLTEIYYTETSLAQRWQNIWKLTLPSSKESFNFWAHFIQSLLHAAGWPGQRVLSSHEYQIGERWCHLLQDFKQLDNILPPTHFNNAISLLKDLCQLVVFQPQSSNQPIQILGMLEAAGMEFKKMWIMGLDDESWPPKAIPNPFLPLELQRRLAMPHASAIRELIYCQQIQQRLFSSSPEIILSSAQQQDDKKLFVSQLIKSIPLSQLTTLTPTPLDLFFERAQLEKISDLNGPPLALNYTPGGSQILKLQATCSFKAFATARLKALPLTTPTLGLSAITRGILCHRVLELFWKKVKTQSHLLRLSDDELDATINEVIAAAINSLGLIESFYLTVEQERLFHLLRAWLFLEKERPAFRVVERERRAYVQIGPLKLNIQIDRIDELESGHYLIIDYKTGENNRIQEWLTERPLEPQLPIYCIYGSAHVLGIAYAEINLRQPQFIGLINSNQKISKIKNVSDYFKNACTWDELKRNWQITLERLSQEFYAGYAARNPQEETVCQQCQLHALCRIGESEC